MKNILMAACCAVIMFAANNAKADCETQTCTASINSDSGVTLKNCTDTGVVGNDCECTTASTGASAVKIVTGICGGNWALEAYMIDGSKCCGWVDKNAAPSEQDFIDSEARAESKENLDAVYNVNFDGSRATEYYGYADSTIRSPTAGGRATAAKAKLDACLFHSDVDWIDTNGGSNDSEKHATCVGIDYGCGNTGKNEYCNATGMNDGVSVSAAVCKDRCDCVYGQGTCAGL